MVALLPVTDDNDYMSTDSNRILDAALSLPPGERADLAYRLLQSLKPPGVWSIDDPAFDAELERRMAAYESGQTPAEDWETVSERVRQALKDRKSS